MSSSPPGPKGEPLFGSSRRYARDPFRFLSACEQAYGDVVQFDMGPIETYLLTDPEDIEQVLVSEAGKFAKPEFQDDALGDLLGKGLLMSDGQTWRDQRQLANPAFAMGRLTDFADDIVTHSDELLVGWQDGDVVNVEQEMTDVTLAVIVDLMLDTDLSDDRVGTIREALEPLGARFEPDPVRFAAPEWVPMPGDSEYGQAIDTMEGVIDGIVEERRGSEGDPETDEGPDDLLSVLLRAQARGEQTDRQIRDEVMTMLLAGHDTTALTLTYTWYLLSQHPEVERRLHAELDSVLDGSTPTAADARQLEYTEQVLNEAMRLYPPVYTLFREAATDVKIGGYRIPAGSGLMLPQWVVHRSPRWYDNPDQFNPDRFNSERVADRPRFSFFPFGGGPRHCIGKQFSMLEAKLILATVAQEYRLDYLGDALELRGSLTMHPREPMAMRLESR